MVELVFVVSGIVAIVCAILGVVAKGATAKDIDDAIRRVEQMQDDMDELAECVSDLQEEVAQLQAKELHLEVTNHT